MANWSISRYEKQLAKELLQLPPGADFRAHPNAEMLPQYVLVAVEYLRLKAGVDEPDGTVEHGKWRPIEDEIVYCSYYYGRGTEPRQRRHFISAEHLARCRHYLYADGVRAIARKILQD